MNMNLRKLISASPFSISAVPIIVLLLLTGCNESPKTSHDHSSDEVYTCPMHPTVIQDKPGACPICGMDLVKVKRSEATRNFIMLSDAQMKLANISVKPVSKIMFGESSNINGRFALNEERSQVISSRVPGRIEKVFIKENGESVSKGQPVYTIFSEQLLTLQQEYLLAAEQNEKLGQTEKRYQSIRDAAEKKLLLYGLSKNQVSQIKNRSDINPNITFFSPAAGVVTEINITEGQYIDEGSILFRLEDLSNLWVEAELFPDETGNMRIGDKITVDVNGSNADTFEATVSFLSPELRANTQIIVMRGSVNNPSLKYKPGQQVNILVSHSEKETITVPVDAVIRNEKGAHVYVQNGKNTFEPRMVETGIENYRDVEIKTGIAEGDTIAVSGAYLLYSEMILKKGNDPMAGHPVQRR
jgi:Cu(I)/Ag(I) efflux system membrane fusion protein